MLKKIFVIKSDDKCIRLWIHWFSLLTEGLIIGLLLFNVMLGILKPIFTVGFKLSYIFYKY